MHGSSAHVFVCVFVCICVRVRVRFPNACLARTFKLTGILLIFHSVQLLLALKPKTIMRLSGELICLPSPTASTSPHSLPPSLPTGTLTPPFHLCLSPLWRTQSSIGPRAFQTELKRWTKRPHMRFRPAMSDLVSDLR